MKRADSPSDRVGGGVLEKFEKVTHRVAMLSLDNAFSEEDVRDFVDRVRRFLKLSADAPLVFTAEQRLTAFPWLFAMKRVGLLPRRRAAMVLSART